MANKKGSLKRFHMKSSTLKKLNIFFLIILFLFLNGILSYADTPIDLITKNQNEVIRVLNNSDELHKRKALWEIWHIIFEYEQFARHSLPSDTWEKLTESDKEDFTKAFIEVVGNVYINLIIDRFKDTKTIKKNDIFFGKPEQTMIHEEKAKININIITNDGKKEVIFRFGIYHNEWKAYDILIEGVSLIVNYKAQFYSHLTGGSDIKNLIRQLRIMKIELEK